MPTIEYAVDIWDLSETDGRPNAEELLDHLREFADEGWELVSLSFNIDLVRHGPTSGTSWTSCGRIATPSGVTTTASLRPCWPCGRSWPTWTRSSPRPASTPRSA